MTKMTRNKFSSHFDIPLNILKDWETECPDYIYDLIEYRIRKEHLMRVFPYTRKKRENRIIFLDYDGVVNNYLWEDYPLTVFGDAGFKPKYAFPEDGFVNNFQAICWLNKLYEEYPYDIVVTSTWRDSPNYRECLYAGGLSTEIAVIGCVKKGLGNYKRDKLIAQWIEENKFDGSFVIIDDESYLYFPDTYNFNAEDHLIITNGDIGYINKDYEDTIKKFKHQENWLNGKD